MSLGVRRILLAVSSVLLGTLALAAPASATTATFDYTGAAQTWTVPAGVTEATFDLYGAQGGGDQFNPDFAAGLGGRATATIPVTPGASIQVNVGGQGSLPAGGFNGGGDAVTNSHGNPGNGGGGASDIRIGGTALTDRVLVAGGGGGAGLLACNNASAVGGHGGDLSGLPGDSSECQGGVGGGGGTQTAGGTATSPATAGSSGVGGTGGVGADDSGGGGGGGWWGGGGGLIGGGGGGSGHGPPGTVYETGVRSGNGLVTVTYTEPSIATLIRSVADLNLPLGTEAALLNPLITAAVGLVAGKIGRACNQLAAFIALVKGESGTSIDPADADALIGEAEAVRESLNCGAGISCAGEEATIVGTGRAEKLRGTSGDDVIAAGGGDDTVVGLRGDDLVCGSGSADVIRGQGGDDILMGGRGSDVLRGGRSADRCRGGGGADSEHQC